MKKKVILTVLIMCSFINLLAQDKEPEKMVFLNPSTSNTFVFDISQPEYQQTNFILGWQWGGHQRMGEALKMKSLNIMKKNVQLAKENVQLAKENVHLAKENVHLAEENVHLAKENVHLEAQPHVFLL